MLRCPVCGNETDGGDAFCRHCGEPLDKNGSEGGSVPSGVVSTDTAKVQGQRIESWVIAVIGAIVLAIGVYLLITFSNTYTRDIARYGFGGGYNYKSPLTEHEKEVICALIAGGILAFTGIAGMIFAAAGDKLHEIFNGAQSNDAQSATMTGAIPGMKWYKFLIYVYLFLGAAANAITAYLYLTGTFWEITTGVSVSRIYSSYSGLQAMSIAQGFASICLAVGAIIVRKQLADYEANAPREFIWYLIAALVVSLIFDIWTGIAMGGIAMSPSLEQIVTLLFIIGYAGRIVFIGLNRIYFEKRASAFAERDFEDDPVSKNMNAEE